jgi:DNA ligase (NAD+)
MADAVKVVTIEEVKDGFILAQDLVWEADFLMCNNHGKCPAQIIESMSYFFKILANNDGFGVATISKLYQRNIRRISQIYALDIKDLVAMGFGDKTSENLVNQLRRSTVEQIEDWRFLAAFGAPRLGLGNCENLLKNYTLNEIFALSVEQISAIEGFAELSAKLIVAGLQAMHAEFITLSKYGFDLELTASNTQLIPEHEFSHKRVIFTGKMHVSRAQMHKQAKTLGMQVVASISAKTDLLIIGANVGAKKLSSAAKFKVKIMTESDYLAKLDAL